MPEDFTKQDIIRFIEGNNIQMLNFRYVAADGKLKNLSLPSPAWTTDRVLAAGERVDGSSLSLILMQVQRPLCHSRYRTAYINPFASIPTLDILCSYYNNLGTPRKALPNIP